MGAIAAGMVHRTGLSRQGQEHEGARWVAVRRGPHNIHRGGPGRVARTGPDDLAAAGDRSGGPGPYREPELFTEVARCGLRVRPGSHRIPRVRGGAAW